MRQLDDSPVHVIFGETNLPRYNILANWYYTEIDESKQIWNGTERIISPVKLYGAVGEVLKAELTGDRVQVQEARRMLHRDMFHGFLVWMIIILIMTLIHLLRLMIQH